jgi:kinesin family member C1
MQSGATMESLVQMFSDHVHRIHRVVEAYSDRVVQLEEALKRASEREAQLLQEQASARQLLQEANKQVQERDSAMQQKERELQHTIQTLRNQMETCCLEKTKPLESENDRLRSKIQDTTSENESLKAKVAELQEKGKQLESENDMLKSNLHDTVDKFKSENVTLKSKVDELQEKGKQLESDMDLLNSNLHYTVEKFTSENAALKAKVDELQKIIDQNRSSESFIYANNQNVNLDVNLKVAKDNVHIEQVEKDYVLNAKVKEDVHIEQVEKDYVNAKVKEDVHVEQVKNDCVNNENANEDVYIGNDFEVEEVVQKARLEKEHAAALKIVSFMRFAVKKQKMQREKEKVAALKIVAFMRFAVKKRRAQRVVVQKARQEKENAAALKIVSFMRFAVKKQKMKREKEKAAALKIIAFMRFAVKKRKAQREKENAAASKISSFMRLAWAKKSIEIEKAKEKLRREQEAELKRQRNAAIHSKGLIRAFCRVKPFLGKDKVAQKETSVVKAQDGSNALVLLNPSGIGSKAYLLDHVFVPETTQEDVFDQVEDLVESALDGNHVCLMAYGQTGSGKSFTMEGTAKNPGLIPRAAVKLFDGSRAMEGWTLSFKISSFQIYHDQAQDLLSQGSEPTLCSMQAKGKNSNGVELRGLTKVQIFSSEEILRYFDLAMKRRSTEATAKNATSSRSHFVFKIDICAERSGDPNSYGHLYFVDLAGSEAQEAGRNAKQKADGDDIRNSLTALKTFLVRAAQNKNGDARSASICRYMQHVLSRPEAKLLVIANISADLQSFSQTKDALEFVADIAKLKQFQDKSPDFIAASKIAAAHDKKRSDQGKPWKKQQQRSARRQD